MLPEVLSFTQVNNIFVGVISTLLKQGGDFYVAGFLVEFFEVLYDCRKDTTGRKHKKKK